MRQTQTHTQYTSNKKWILNLWKVLQHHRMNEPNEKKVKLNIQMKFKCTGCCTLSTRLCSHIPQLRRLYRSITKRQQPRLNVTIDGVSDGVFFAWCWCTALWLTMESRFSASSLPVKIAAAYRKNLSLMPRLGLDCLGFATTSVRLQRNTKKQRVWFEQIGNGARVCLRFA